MCTLRCALFFCFLVSFVGYYRVYPVSHIIGRFLSIRRNTTILCSYTHKFTHADHNTHISCYVMETFNLINDLVGVAKTFDSTYQAYCLDARIQLSLTQSQPSTNSPHITSFSNLNSVLLFITGQYFICGETEGDNWINSSAIAYQQPIQLQWSNSCGS